VNYLFICIMLMIDSIHVMSFIMLHLSDCFTHSIMYYHARSVTGFLPILSMFTERVHGLVGR
jgi:hypothetical protein